MYRGATSVQEGGASKIFLPSFLPIFALRETQNTRTHMHKMDWWFDPMISSYSFDSLLLLLLPLLLLLLFLFLRRLKLTASLLSFLLRWKFHFQQFENICCCCCGVGLFVCRSAFDQFPTHVYTVKSCLHLLFCRAAIFSLLCGFLRLRLGGKNVSLVLTDDQSIIISARLVAVLSNPAALFPVSSPFIRDWQFLVSTSCLYHKFDKGSCR